ncbi:MAG: MBL fold metallo-hydrolase [Syntrophales bacterium]|nr:MBL fold metallo-hydrolase [Syntrophales bacterium]
MKVTIIYDNETCQPGLEAAWGFSCLVEANGRRLLFDTGGDGTILLKNMETLNLDPRSIPEIFISHDHWDHLGGLAELLRLNPEVRVYFPWSCPRPPEAREAISVRTPLKISENFFSSGELPGREQSLVVKTEKGLAVICGCSHPGVKTILEAASNLGRVKALVGGLHGFNEYKVLADLALVCPCHCTKHKAEIMARYPETAVSCGAGKVLEYG